MSAGDDVKAMGAVISDLKHSPSYAAYREAPYRSIKHSSYFTAYDELFGRYYGNPVTFVEIGVLDGGSLFMWRELFGPEARIIGIELNPEAKRWEKDGFEIYCGSQSDRGFWRRFVTQVGPVDVVLDDGGHTFEQQIVTTECLLPHVADGGILAVEDTHTSYLRSFGGPSPVSFMEFAKNIVDGINYRSEKLVGRPHEKTVHSLHFFESIVAFKIDRRQAVPSHEVDNDKPGFSAYDFRYGAPKPDRKSSRLKQKIGELIPVAKLLIQYIRRKWVIRKLRMKKRKRMDKK